MIVKYLPKFIISHLLLVILCSLAFAADISPRTSIIGFYENDLVGVFPRQGESLGGDLNRLRLRVDSALLPNVTLHFEPEYDALVKPKPFPLVGVSSLDQLVWNRTYLKIYMPGGDLILGKQRIAWGSGYIWNPTDVFNPFTLSFAVEDEQKKEPEAVRLEIPLGEAAGIDTFIQTGNEWVSAKKGIRARTNVGLYDLALSLVDLGKGGYQFGFDTAGELFGLGVRSEFVLISPAGANGYIQSVWGWNYTLDNGWGLDMEYFFNGLGKRDKGGYDWAGLAAGNINQLGMDYVYFGLNKTLDEITGVRFSWLFNANDMSYIFYPSYSRNIFQNIDLSLEAMLMGGGEGTEYMPSATQDPSGFIGSKILFLRVRYSF
jgi:hypothetical protein